MEGKKPIHWDKKYILCTQNHGVFFTICYIVNYLWPDLCWTDIEWEFSSFLKSLMWLWTTDEDFLKAWPFLWCPAAVSKLDRGEARTRQPDVAGTTRTSSTTPANKEFDILQHNEAKKGTIYSSFSTSLKIYETDKSSIFFSSARVRLRLKFAPLKNLNAISVGLVFRANIPIDVFANQSFIEIGLFHSTECLSQGWSAW